MGELELIWNYQEILNSIYQRENLQCLRGLDGDYIIKNRNILEWYHDVVKTKFINDVNNFYLKNFDDLLIISDEILFFTAQVFLYHPYINNPLKESIVTNEYAFYTNHQNLEAKRFYMFIDVVYEKIYNYWDKIGDLIASFFQNKFQQKNIYFVTVLDAIPEEFCHERSFVWLNNFKTNEYFELNKKRKKVVHYNTSDTLFNNSHLSDASNFQHIQKLINERDEIPSYLKKHIDLTIEGFCRALDLINVIQKSNI